MTTATSTTSAPTGADQGTPAVTARGVVKTYGKGSTAVLALDGVDLTIPSGAMTAIMGPSGSGKSTLMHVLAGLDDADSGSVRLGELELTVMSEKQRTLVRRERVGFVFQAFNLVPSLTAEENITLPLRLAGRRVDRGWLADLVDTLGLGDRLSHRPAQMSGGQQQRVAVARALVTRPDVVFADEPTGNLDSRRGHALLETLRDAAHQMGQTVVMVTHDPSAASFADRVVFLADGRTAGDMPHASVAGVLARMADLEQRDDEARS